MNFLKNEIILNDLKEIHSTIDFNAFKDKTVMVSGAYGMLASYIVYELIYLNETQNMNINIVGIVKDKEKLEKRFGEYVSKSYFNTIFSNLKSPVNYDGDVDYIIHAAGFSNAMYYSTVPVDVLEPNTIGTYHLMEFAREKNIESFIFLSTANIYGQVDNLKYIEEDSYGALSTLDAHSCYEESKRMGETICASYFNQYGVHAKIVRMFHGYGPTMNLEDPRVFSSFTKDIIEGNDIQMKSDGLAKRSFSYITDIVTGIFTILLKGENGEAYNLANTKEFISIVELAENLVQIFPERNLKVIKVKRDKNENYIEYKANDDSVPCTRKLESLGWSADISTKEGFKRVIQFKEMIK